MIEIVNNQLELDNEKLNILYFSAAWCGPCKILKPVMTEISSERTDVNILYIDINQNMEIAGKYGIMSVPTLIFIKGGEVKNKIVGLQPYSGNFLKFPATHKIEEMVDAFKSAPIAYTLDIAVLSNNTTVIVEAHDFFSCGLYGFNNQAILPYMYSRWWYNYINNIRYKGD